MAILSANSRRSPTTTAESSPTTEPLTNPMEPHPEKTPEKSSVQAKSASNESTQEKSEKSPNESSVRGTSVYSFCYKTEINISTEETSKSGKLEESAFQSLSNPSLPNEESTEDWKVDKNESEESQDTDSSQKTEVENDLYSGESTSNEDKINDETVDLSSDLRTKCETKQQNLYCNEEYAPPTLPDNEEASQTSDAAESMNADTRRNSECNLDASKLECSLDKTAEGTGTSNPPRRVFRGDSRDSGIGDCSSNLAASSLQIDELGIDSIIEEEADGEPHESKVNSKKEESARAGRPDEKPKDVLESSRGYDKAKGEVATALSGLTKPACESNRQLEGAGESEDPRALIGRVRSKFVPTGNVSRTAKLFEKEAAKSTNNSQVTGTQRAYPTATVATGKPHNERIQKAFAFWNK